MQEQHTTKKTNYYEFEHLLNYNTYPDNDVLKKVKKTTHLDFNRYYFYKNKNEKITFDFYPDKIIKNIYLKNYFLPDFVVFEKIGKEYFISSKNIYWFKNNTQHISINYFLINFISFFYKKMPHKFLQKNEEYDLNKELLKNQFKKSSLTKNQFLDHFNIPNNLKQIKDKFIQLNFNDFIEHAENIIFINKKQTEKDFPYKGETIPTLKIKYNQKIQNTECNLILDYIYLQFFKGQNINLELISYNINGYLVSNLHPNKVTLDNIKTKIYNPKKTKFNEFIEINFKKNKFPLEIENIILPKKFQHLGLNHIINFEDKKIKYKNYILKSIQNKSNFLNKSEIIPLIINKNKFLKKIAQKTINTTNQEFSLFEEKNKTTCEYNCILSIINEYRENKNSLNLINSIKKDIYYPD